MTARAGGHAARAPRARPAGADPARAAVHFVTGYFSRPAGTRATRTTRPRPHT